MWMHTNRLLCMCKYYYFNKKICIVALGLYIITVSTYPVWHSSPCNDVTDSSQHGRLPKPQPQNKCADKLVNETVICVGFKFIYSHSQPYSIVDDEVVMGSLTMPETGSTYIKNSRTFSLAVALVQQFCTTFNIETEFNNNKYCLFGGSAAFKKRY